MYSHTSTEILADTGAEMRRLARDGFNGLTAGQAPDYLQGNVVILPKSYAADFLQYCKNNPKPCPLIGMSAPGDTAIPGLGDIDMSRDIPRYRVFRNGEAVEDLDDIAALWRDDLVSFVMGCSFTFEEALMREGFEVRHIARDQNVGMYDTSIQTVPGGIFQGPVVVTMRPYKAADIPAVYDICARYPQAHGAPLYWGDPAAIGIADLGKPDYGDPVELKSDEVPVFWACGVTTQAALIAAKPDFCITHAPGHMLVTDRRSGEAVGNVTGMAALAA